VVAVAAGLAQVAWQKLRTGRVERLQAITVAVLVVFGGLTLLLRDPLFIKWKPTVVYWLLGAGFLATQFIGSAPLVQRMLGHALVLPDRIWRRLNLAWLAFFILMGLINLYVAFSFPENVWVNFKLFGLMGLTLAFVVVQSFYVARHIPDESADEAEEET
jgi:intracellular septation protein